MVTIREPSPGIPPSLAAGPGRAIGAAVVLAISGAAAFAVSHWPLWAVAGVLIAILLLVAVSKLQFAVAILVASFYFDTYLAVGAGVVTVGKLLGALALVAWFLRWIVARQPIVASPLLWPLAGLAAWIPLSVSTAYDQAAGLSVALRYLTFFVLVFLVVQTVGEDRRTATRMLDVAVAAGAASALVGLYIFFFIANDGRAQGPLEDPNDYAFLFAAILASFSRSALVGLAVAGAWAAVTRRLPLKWALVIAGGLVAVALVSYLLQPERVESALVQKRHVAQSNIDQRLVAWQVALEQFRSSPVLGVGPGNFEVRFDEFELPPDPELGALAAHNAYLDVLAELGAPGLCLFLVYLGLAWSRLRRRAPGDPVADGLQSALAAGFVVAMVGALFLTEQYYSPLWLLPAVGALLVGDRSARRAAVERGA
jgi:O-antigen ligase